MVIRSSNLCLRFYRRDGWSKELMEVLIKPQFRSKVTIADSQDKGDDETCSYFVITAFGKDVVDMDLLLKLKTELIRAFDDYPDQSDEDFMRSHL